MILLSISFDHACILIWCIYLKGPLEDRLCLNGCPCKIKFNQSITQSPNRPFLFPPHCPTRVITKLLFGPLMGEHKINLTTYATLFFRSKTENVSVACKWKSPERKHSWTKWNIYFGLFNWSFFSFICNKTAVFFLQKSQLSHGNPHIHMHVKCHTWLLYGLRATWIQRFCFTKHY